MDHQNNIRVWFSKLTGVWHARIGPDDERGREAEGLRPIEAVCALVTLLQWDGYAFDATPPAPKALPAREAAAA
jgi:hypothetical protein